MSRLGTSTTPASLLGEAAAAAAAREAGGGDGDSGGDDGGGGGASLETACVAVAIFVGLMAHALRTLALEGAGDAPPLRRYFSTLPRRRADDHDDDHDTTTMTRRP